MALVSLDDELALLKVRPAGAERVLTGPGAPPEPIARADVITHMTAVRHTHQQGIRPRPEIEF